ncbi:MAG: FtsH protease activity modulator HflK [Rhodospirillales bacterium]
MPWNQQGGGGPWGGGGNNGGSPWGKKPSGGGGGGGGTPPPVIEEMLRKSQDKLRRVLPGGFGGGKGLIIAGIIAVLVWGASGFYRVQPGEEGVQLLFGEFNSRTSSGLNYWFPAPFGGVDIVDVESIRRVQIGYSGQSGRGRDNASESLILTGDQNIVDMDVDVLWRVSDAANYIFNVRDPETTVKIMAESSLREVVGQTTLDNALTEGRAEVQARTQAVLQQTLDQYQTGIEITNIQLQKADPPQPVIDAFNEVQRARQDKERLQNEAEAYRNSVVPVARGEAQKMIQGAQAYKEKVTAEAEGEAQKFLSVYETYKGSKDITRQRIFLETMAEIYGKSSKIIIDGNASGGSGVVPYLPLDQLQKRGAQQ